MKRSRILASEAIKTEQINSAEGEAKAIIARAEAKARGIKLVGDMLRSNSGENAAALTVAEQYVKAFSQLAKTNNTIILSNDASDVAKMTTQALQVFRSLKSPQNDEGFEDKGFDGNVNPKNPVEYYSDIEHRSGHNK
ncbi:unnamed protein product [Medioppia subpectinata]|uniref:STML2-like C-terminal extension domain-containing protein n=1 Tax=Medioppia subpectinata TaxID=1979941 RepID=A0A7R9LY94_9ACAR|nr:unnamed protein product [Medioppia subpectinata]CAG2122505.1 unnamed protein product [Medioppia subpectinata]